MAKVIKKVVLKRPKRIGGYITLSARKRQTGYGLYIGNSLADKYKTKTAVLKDFKDVLRQFEKKGYAVKGSKTDKRKTNEKTFHIGKIGNWNAVRKKSGFEWKNDKRKTSIALYKDKYGTYTVIIGGMKKGRLFMNKKYISSKEKAETYVKRYMKAHP